MCAFAAFAGMLFGYDSGYISSVLGMEQFKLEYGQVVDVRDQNAVLLPGSPNVFVDYTTWQKSLIVSILSAGTFFGALISGSLADRFGRHTTIIAGCAIFIVGVVVQVSATYVAALAVGRVVAGFGVGFVSAINILYMSEVAPRRIRGAIVSSYQFAITMGIMLASCVCYATQNRQDTGAFRIPISIQFLWAIMLATGLFFLPESPRYFVKKGDLDAAADALARVRGQHKDSEYILDELAEIQANYEYEKDIGEEGWRGCFAGGWKRNSNLRKILIGTMLQFWQQWTGINFIFCESLPDMYASQPS
jgi:SP family sugar:H+ symporter-like MFS transporter